MSNQKRGPKHIKKKKRKSEKFLKWNQQGEVRKEAVGKEIMSVVLLPP
jgi:hypothetical protein